jgi:hypothetical protein
VREYVANARRRACRSSDVPVPVAPLRGLALYSVSNSIIGAAERVTPRERFGLSSMSQQRLD